MKKATKVMINNNMTKTMKYKHRLTALHATSPQNANLIIKSQHFNLGKGLFHQGVYFANTVEAALLKTKHQKIKDMTILVADVYVGNYVDFTKKEALSGMINTESLKNQGVETIIGYHLPTGKEIVCLYENRIYNIKYAFGVRPTEVFKIDRPRITLFYVCSKNEAIIIHLTQTFQQTNGPFGKAFYLFDNITDAKDNSNDGTTYLACDAHVDNLYELKNNETIKSTSAYNNGCKAFLGEFQSCPYYMFLDIRLIDNIHYCGGEPWDKY